MPKHKVITKAAADRIKPPKEGQVDHFDSSLPGLALRVSHSGRKHRQIVDIKRRDVLDLIDGIADRGHVTMARRIFGHLHRLFVWSVGRGIIEINPMQNLPKPGSETQRDRVFTDSELVKVWRACDQLGDYGQAAKVLVLTGARREEISKLRWDEIDGVNSANGASIVLAGDRTKTSEPRTIPLSTAAQAIIKMLPRVGDFVFAAGLPDWSRAKRRSTSW